MATELNGSDGGCSTPGESGDETEDEPPLQIAHDTLAPAVNPTAAHQPWMRATVDRSALQALKAEAVRQDAPKDIHAQRLQDRKQ